MTIRIDGTNTTANPGITGGDADTGFQFGTDEVKIVTGGSDRVTVDSSGNLQFDSGYGSVATAYGCRAWVNFDGTGTVVIRESGNVSSITDNGTGNYTVNFATAMPDSNFALVGAAGAAALGDEFTISFLRTDTSTSSKRIFCSTNYQPGTSNGVARDEIVHVAFFR